MAMPRRSVVQNLQSASLVYSIERGDFPDNTLQDRSFACGHARCMASVESGQGAARGLALCVQVQTARLPDARGHGTNATRCTATASATERPPLSSQTGRRATLEAAHAHAPLGHSSEDPAAKPATTLCQHCPRPILGVPKQGEAFVCSYCWIGGRIEETVRQRAAHGAALQFQAQPVVDAIKELRENKWAEWREFRQLGSRDGCALALHLLGARAFDVNGPFGIPAAEPVNAQAPSNAASASGVAALSSARMHASSQLPRAVASPDAASAPMQRSGYASPLLPPGDDIAPSVPHPPAATFVSRNVQVPTTLVYSLLLIVFSCTRLHCKLCRMMCTIWRMRALLYN